MTHQCKTWFADSIIEWIYIFKTIFIYHLTSIMRIYEHILYNWQQSNRP